MKVISLKELKLETGYFDKIFQTFDESISKCESEGYTKEVGRLIKLIIDFGFIDYDDWLGKEYDAQREQINNSAIWANIFIIRLNNIAQKHLNNIEMEPIHVQLNSDIGLEHFLKGTTFVE